MIASPIMSKANQVKELLLSEIESGKYTEGDRLPSDNVLMRELKVSRNTVREALSFLTTEGHVIRIQGKGTYVTNKQSAELDIDRGMIHIISRDEHGSQEANPFVSELLRGSLKAVEEKPVAIKLTTFTGDDWFLPPQRLDAICAEKPRGVMLAAFPVTANIVKQFHQRNIPCCSLGTPAEGVDIPYIEIDHYQAIQEAVNHLVAKNHRKIVLIHGTQHKPSGQARINGFRDALKKAGIPFKTDMLQNVKMADYHSAKQTVMNLLEKKVDFTALIVYGDYATLSAIQELTRHQLSVPDDISLIMYGGFEWACRACGMQITRIKQPFHEVGKKAVELLLSSDKNKHLLLKTTFIDGETCKKIEEA